MMAASNPADRLLTMLDGVVRCGSGRWMARCPAHDDATPSLSVREAEDGRVLIHCFGGCGACDVLTALGLTARDLYPAAPPGNRYRAIPAGQRFVPRDVFQCVGEEVLVVWMVSEQLERGEALKPEDIDRLAVASKRLQGAAREVGIHA